MKPPLKCPYCEAEAVLYMSSAKLYHGRDFGPAWVCEPCKAWVGCHPSTTTPLGRLANAELREWKRKAHLAFDALWKRKMVRDGVRKHEARGDGYQWLAKTLGIPAAECHIGMFDVDQCKQVVEACAPYQRRAA